ncbi:RagB/SusD family nutrient uptake outer membrane protein [Sinomicrobium oceani]|uniref:RagB/SusD family nutrient uptake outer membrane protein n=1 Tax=Sinomicrobium oceani TaxID=1150368 RepID=UPI00227B94B7|nr:RagB/SusD family nutrient uptake outer membrane protein [Sinomicrobium oceani]
MMKKIYKVLSLSIVLSVFGCDGYLDEVPDNRTTLDSTEKVKELLVNAYPRAMYVFFTEYMSDNAGDKGIVRPDAVQMSLDSYFWEENFNYINQDSPQYFWNGCYSNIAVANQALEALDEIEADEEEEKVLRAEARLTRAYAHFMLVSLWGKTYDPATSGSDPGVPLVTEPETVVFADYERASVREIYDFIEKEIEESIPEIRDEAYVPEAIKYHFNKEAANAFACRFYLFKGDWENAEKYAGNIIGANVASRLRDWNGYKVNSTFEELKADYTDPSNRTNLLVTESLSWWGRRYTNQRYGITIDIRDNVLQRHNPTGGSWAYRVFGSVGYYNVPKFEENFVPNTPGGSTGRGWLEFPLFSMEEVLLNRAEARLMQGRNDEAIADLNIFYSKRILNYNDTHIVDAQGIIDYYSGNPAIVEELDSYYDLPADTKYILQAIVDARRIEFIEEGLRWFDIRRFHIPITHRYGDSEYLLEQTPMEMPGDSPMHQLQIPQTAMSVLEKNPR